MSGSHLQAEKRHRPGGPILLITAFIEESREAMTGN